MLVTLVKLVGECAFRVCSCNLNDFDTILDGIVYSPIARMCVTTTTTKTFVAVWSLPVYISAVLLTLQPHHMRLCTR